MKAKGQEQLDRGASRINEELMTPALAARIKRAVKDIRQFRQRRLQRFGEEKRLIDSLVRIREECGQFAAWVAIARIHQNQNQDLSMEDKAFLEDQKKILRGRKCSSDDELIQLIFNL